MRYFLAVVFALMLSAGGAFAHHSPGHGVPPGQGGGEGGGGIGGGGGGGAGGDGGAGGHAHQGQAQGQLQGQLQGQGQAQGQIGINKNTNFNVNDSNNRAYGGDASAKAGAVAGAFSGGNKTSQNVNFQDSGRQDANINYSGNYEVKNVPSIAIGGPASGPCNGFSGGIGASWLGGSIAANTSTVDDGCEDRETARMFHLLGDTASGLELLKTSKAYTRMQERKAEIAKKKAEVDAEKAAQTAKDVIRAKNPSSDGSWTTKDYNTKAEPVQPTRIWTGNSEGQLMSFTSFPESNSRD